MASRAGLAENRRVGQSVGSRRDVVMATLARSRDRRRGLGESTRAGYEGLRPDVLRKVSAGQMAGGAGAQIAREPHTLVVSRSQDVGVGQVLAAVNAMDLHGHVHALSRSSVREGRIVADGAFLRRAARAAMYEAQIGRAGRA